MVVLIENYRGVDILFDSDNERFTYSYDVGNQSEKQTFSSCKKSIDDYYKNNSSFQPFLVRCKSTGNVLKIVGIRKDNRLVSEVDGYRSQVSDWDESYYIEFDESHNEKYLEIELLKKEIKDLEEKILKTKKTITGKSLKELKQKYLFIK